MATLDRAQGTGYPAAHEIRSWLAFALLLVPLSMVVGYGLGGMPHHAVLLLVQSLALLAAIGALVWFRARRHGPMDFPALFALGFLAYNVIVPLEAAFYSLAGRPLSFRGYVETFAPETYVEASQMGLLAALGLGIGVLLASRWAGDASHSGRISLSTLGSRAGLRSACVLLAVTVIGAFLQYSSVGGIRRAIGSSRGARLDALNYGSGQSIPYWAPLLIALVFLTANYVLTRRRGTLLLLTGTITSWAAFNVVLGERGLILYALVVVGGCWGVLAPEAVHRHRRLILFLGIALYIAFALLSNVRALLPYVLDSETRPAALQQISSQANIGWLIPSATEFSSPYFTLLWNLEHPTERLGGSSYVRAIPDVLPRVIHPDKPYPLGRSFAQEMRRIYSDELSRARGWAYSPVTEAWVNFGPIGIPVVFMFVGLGLTLVTRLRGRGLFPSLLYVALLTQVINLNRSNFTLIETVMLGAATAMSYVILLVFLHLSQSVVQPAEKVRVVSRVGLRGQQTACE